MIDEENDEERSHQVRIMTDIYAAAAELIMFLGDGRVHRITDMSSV
jgi:hypothetical protein